ncbi:iron-sulfur cluster assembly scaffold protein [Alkalihalobacillus sp. FSL R5-0424]
MFNEIISDHFMNPRNIGELDHPDFVVEIGNPICGDTVHMFLRVENEKILDVSYLAYGCSTSIATASIVSEKIKGKKLIELSHYQKNDVHEWLGELEPAQNHCVDIGLSILNECMHPSQKQIKAKTYLVEDEGALS